MSGDLRALAAEYVALQDKVEAVRRSMLACLTNGAGDHPVRPTRPARALGGKAAQAQGQELQSQPNHIEAAKLAEEKILELLKAGPLRMAEISSQMSARQSTTSERLRRMRDRHLIARDGEGWAIVASA